MQMLPYRVRGLTERFDEYGDYHSLWPSQWPVTLLNTYGSGATGETALSTTVPKILNEGVLFGRMLFIPPAEFHTLLESITSSFEAALHFSHQLK